MADLTEHEKLLSDHHPLLYDHYEIERVLGMGAMGVVYLARDVRIGRQVALKTLQSRRKVFENDTQANEFLERFRREAELCGSLIHPNIVTLYEVGYEQSRLTYLAMEYVEGESLHSLLRRTYRVSLETAFKVADDLLQGLAYAHDRDIIHRDIKPANILVSLDGHAKITDFGVARSVRENVVTLTQAGDLLGTPHYMAPEHIAGREIDGRSDLFSLGVVLFEMLTGRKPFEGPGITDVLYNVVNRPAPSIQSFCPELPRWCALFVERLMQKAPKDRFLSASAATRELRRLVNLHRRGDEFLPLDLRISITRPVSAEETPTTPIGKDQVPRKNKLFDINVARPVAYGLIGIAASLLLISTTMIARRINDSPTVSITPDHSARLEEKKKLLDEAAILLNAGAYKESIKRFDEVLTQYPENVAALHGRDKAEKALRARGIEPPKRPKRGTSR